MRNATPTFRGQVNDGIKTSSFGINWMSDCAPIFSEETVPLADGQAPNKAKKKITE